MASSSFGLAFLLFVAMSNYIVLTKAQAVERRSFGQHCNETTKCDKGAWLGCKASVCACLIEDMIFDQIKGKCVSKPGERCKFQVSAESATENLGIAFYENTDCVTNAHCANGFTCSCVSGYYETMDGLCLEQKTLNATCLSSSECQISKLLFCLDGQCQCSKENYHIWDKANNDSSMLQCVGKAGKPLTGSTSCVEGTRLENGVCTCLEGDEFYAGEDGRCYEKKLLNSSCLKDDECQFVGKFLTCINNQCVCDPTTSIFQTFYKDRIVQVKQEVNVKHRNYQRPDSSYGENSYYKWDSNNDVVIGTWVRDDTSGSRFQDYNYNYGNTYYKYGYIMALQNKTMPEKLSQCVGLARQKCNAESNCVRDSKCGSDGTCACDYTFSPTSSGSCGIGHGRPCSMATPCSDTFKCTNGICNCPQINHQTYDSSLQKCIGLVNSYCTDDSDCTANMACKVSSDSGRTQCGCADEFVENEEGTCDKAWNSTCTYHDSTPCDSIGRLQCRNGLCACADVLTSFDINSRKCLGLVGTRCYANETSSCVQGGTCIQMNSRLQGRCLCDNRRSYQVTTDFKCHQVFRSSFLSTRSWTTTTTTLPPKNLNNTKNSTNLSNSTISIMTDFELIDMDRAYGNLSATSE